MVELLLQLLHLQDCLLGLPHLVLDLLPLDRRASISRPSRDSWQPQRQRSQLRW